MQRMETQEAVGYWQFWLLKSLLSAPRITSMKGTGVKIRLRYLLHPGLAEMLECTRALDFYLEMKIHGETTASRRSMKGAQ